MGPARRSPAGGLRGQPPARWVPAHHWASVLAQTMPGLSQLHCGIMRENSIHH